LSLADLRFCSSSNPEMATLILSSLLLISKAVFISYSPEDALATQLKHKNNTKKIK
jgi:hypothetical protein